MKKKWGIIGLGWLGSELAAHLKTLDIDYWGTNRKDFDWEKDTFPEKSSDVLFLNTPPLTNLTPDEFVSKIPPKAGRIIFISSIGIYGENTGRITEKTIPKPSTPNGLWLLEVEKKLLKNFSNKLTIIRAGGLIGGSRHPVYSLARNRDKLISEGEINLIHRKDLVAIILALSATRLVIPIVNAVAPYHPLKSEYYSQWSEKLGLGPLKFSHKSDFQKIITSQELDSIYQGWYYPQLDVL